MASPAQIYYVDSGAIVTWVHTGYVETFNLNDMAVLNTNVNLIALLCVQYQNYLGIFRREYGTFIIVSADPAVWYVNSSPAGYICIFNTTDDIIVNRHSASGTLRWGFIEVPGARL